MEMTCWARGRAIGIVALCAQEKSPRNDQGLGDDKQKLRQHAELQQDEIDMEKFSSFLQAEWFGI
jgi:hypothetical protein